MRTIKQLIEQDKKVYILLQSKAIQLRFMSDATREGITFGDGKEATERIVDNIMVLNNDGTICFLGYAGRLKYHYNKNQVVCINYEKYIQGDLDYYI